MSGERKRINCWEFACSWYREEEIWHSIKRNQNTLTRGYDQKIPTDVTSREFAVWLTEQYRLAMAKGIDIGQRGKA